MPVAQFNPRLVRKASQSIPALTTTTVPNGFVAAVTGIAVGLVLAVLTARTLAAWDVGFAIPWTLAILLGGALAAGTLAGVGPARRAARTDPLKALSYE